MSTTTTPLTDQEIYILRSMAQDYEAQKRIDDFEKARSHVENEAAILACERAERAEGMEPDDDD